MEDKYIDAIPKKLIDFFESHKDKCYKVNLSSEVYLEKQELLDETKALLAILCRKYWDIEIKERTE